MEPLGWGEYCACIGLDSELYEFLRKKLGNVACSSLPGVNPTNWPHPGLYRNLNRKPADRIYRPLTVRCNLG